MKIIKKCFSSILKEKLVIPLIFLIILIYSTFLILQNVDNSSDDHLVRMASQFLQKNLWLSPYGLPNGDYVSYFGNIYLYFGPFPSVLLMPFVQVFGKNFPQISIGFASLIVSFFAIFSLSRKLRMKSVDSLWLAIFFAFSTVMFGVSVINITAYQVQALGAVLVLLALNEYFGKKRLLIVGLFLGFAGLTRFTLYLSILFFVIEAIKNRFSRKQLVLLFIPIILSVLVFGYYNQKRYKSVFETGYKYNITLKTYPMSENVKFGFLNLSHVPANLYSLFLKGPEPIRNEKSAFVLKFPYMKVDPWGLAIWYTSPLFLYLLIRPKKDKFTLAALVTFIFLMIPCLLYFGVGYTQFGYRYALDFLPFLFILLIPSLKPSLPLPSKILIFIGAIFNVFYLLSLWGKYPQFDLIQSIFRF